MGHVPLLDELAIIAALAVLVTVVLARLKLPAVAGLLAAGAMMGPHGLRLVRSIESIEVLAEVGVVLLLFSIGLEFSLSRLKDIFRQVALGGAVQVVLTTLATWAIAVTLGQPHGRGLFFGFVFALSSTAIVLRGLAERQELDAPHGRFIVGTLVFQDLCVVPMVLIVPLLGAGGELGAAAVQIGTALLKAALVVVGTVLAARVAVPRVLAYVDASRSREVFLLAILTLCIGTAWLTSLAGLSLSLGAFLGGMVVADTEYGHRAMGDILPLRDAFVSVFFVSLGMLFDPALLATEPLLIALLLAGFLLAKGLLATLAAMTMRFPSRVAWLSGVGLAQFGEFGFVLCRLGESSGVIDDTALQPILAAGILSMFLTPMLMRIAPHITAGERLLAPLERLLGARGIDEAEDDAQHRAISDHVVIVGFGVAGRLVAEALSQTDVPVVALELNAENVKRGRAAGLPVYYGDATSEEALRHAHVERARLLVVLMNDPRGAERVVDTVRRVAPGLPVLMRTRYLAERPRVQALGVSVVVAEEVEGAVEIMARALRFVEAPRNVIEAAVARARSETQHSERKLTVPRPSLRDVRGLDELKIESVLVRDGSPAAGASPASLALRSSTGALVVGVRRAGALLYDTDPRQSFEVDDVAYLVGTSEAIRRALPLFEPSP
jgi:monovalent cation:H+ antiporter-2, CPA2 family